MGNWISSEDAALPLQAICISTLAGAATVFGGLSLILVNKFKPIPFTISLALAGGVMLYVSLVELVPEALEKCSEGLQDIYGDDNAVIRGNGWLIGTSCVILGWAIGCVASETLDEFMSKYNLVGNAKHMDNCENISSSEVNGEDLPEEMLQLGEVRHRKSLGEGVHTRENSPHSDISNTIVKLKIPDRERLKQFVNSHGEWDGQLALQDILSRETRFSRFLLSLKGSLEAEEYIQISIANATFQRDQEKFYRLSIFTAIALGIHNLPEGMATYASYMSDKKFGLGMAFAIAIHNIPEGIAVAMPCYFGTGSAKRALTLCAISAIAEPIGGFIAMGIKSYSDSRLTNGILFALIAGFMLQVSIVELIFTAFRYDPINIATSKSIAAGMLIMSLSLVLFQYF